ncbi:hypothetical protein [Streptacidiphilus fuscans]|uniref:Uncharacterized protein n=1 Tax=Streptacidiphilus fuscans TaxID=2789292 RepID=A0A931FAU7_9ACTN|nr:hypothetical protein [Streptacidiphilus fuscans]MBF9066768.1 hypothetical protein [Streptacidiphilus fuscans]
MVYFLALFALFLAAWGTATIRAGLKVWRNQTPPKWAARSNPMFREAVWQGVRRALVPMGVFQWLLGILFLAAGIVINNDPSGTPSPGPLWANLLLWLAILGLPTSGWLAFSIVSFNRPQFLVPRHLRNQLGSKTAKRQEV